MSTITSGIATQSGPRVGVVTLMVTEQAELQRCEKRIEEGLQTFFEVGDALATIQTGKLYRDTHRTFKAYLKARWNISESRGYQLIEASTVVANLHNCGVQPKNESQARALAKAPSEVQEKVWQEIVEEHGDNATAAKVASAIDARRQQQRHESSVNREKLKHSVHPPEVRKNIKDKVAELNAAASEAGLADELQPFLSAIRQVVEEKSVDTSGLRSVKGEARSRLFQLKRAAGRLGITNECYELFGRIENKIAGVKRLKKKPQKDTVKEGAA